jgi:antibiotic biosynthesis monooxygenase (ABM) superfamily enzyme
MIERHWTGVLRRDAAEHYLTHLRDDIFTALRKLDGFAGASAVTRDVDDGIEFRVVTRWASRASIERFTGPDISVAVIAPEARAMMVRADERATHYELRLRG